MSGRHAGRFVRPLPVAAAAVVVAVLAVAVVGTLRPSPSKRAVAETASPSASASPPASPSPSDRTEDRAARSGVRAAPSHPASPTTGPTRTRSPETGSGTCQASFYADGTRTASGEPFDPNAFTAAHRTLPFNTRLRVTNVANGRSVVVRVNDRGPFVANRCLDLTRAAFAAIASLGAGVATVRYDVLG